MKTTIDIPEALYRKAKIEAIERGLTLKSIMLSALEHELNSCRSGVAEQPIPYFARRKLLPEYEALLKAETLCGGTDSSKIITEERDGR